MTYWHIIFFGLTLLSLITFLALKFTYIQAGMITLLLILIINFVIAIIRGKIQSYLLNEACDPERYLKWNKKQENVMKRKPKSLALLTINKAAAKIVLGEFEEARSLLDEIDKSYLSEKNGTLLIYTINYISCCFELGDIDKALELLDTQIPILSPINKSYKRSINILIGERYYFLDKFNQSYEHLSKLLDIELSRRVYLSILYRLALIDDIRGEEELAQKKYRKIAQLGNKLWVAEQAKKQIKTSKDEQFSYKMS
jgi:tetratricopeptide (TPR) repeat protein